jgi:hypothetical protein
MSQATGQQASKQAEDQASPWTFSVDLTTTSAFSSTSYQVITGGATIQLVKTGNGYTGTMKFNVPVMAGQQGVTPNQIAWSVKTYPLADPIYDTTTQLLSFNVPSAGPAFANNFNAANGVPISPPPNGPVIAPPYVFFFQGTWDGSSETITNGQAWVPGGWLEDANGQIFPGQPPGSGGSSTGGGGGDGGGGDPANATWESGGGT